ATRQSAGWPGRMAAPPPIGCRARPACDPSFRPGSGKRPAGTGPATHLPDLRTRPAEPGRRTGTRPEPTVGDTDSPADRRGRIGGAAESRLSGAPGGSVAGPGPRARTFAGGAGRPGRLRTEPPGALQRLSREELEGTSRPPKA